MSQSFQVSAGKEVVVPGSQDVVYDKVWVSVFNVSTPSKIDPSVISVIQYRFHRELEDGTIEEAPLHLGIKQITVNLNEVLGEIPGGSDLYAMVTNALISLGKVKGEI